MMNPVTTRIPEQDEETLAEPDEETSADRSEVLRQLIRQGLSDRRTERTLDRLRDHTITLRKTVELADPSYVEMLTLAAEAGIDVGYTTDEPEIDLNRIYVVVDSTALIPLAWVGRLDLVATALDDVRPTAAVRADVLTEGARGTAVFDECPEGAPFRTRRRGGRGGVDRGHRGGRRVGDPLGRGRRGNPPRQRQGTDPRRLEPRVERW